MFFFYLKRGVIWITKSSFSEFPYFTTVTPSAARGRRVGVIALPTMYRVPTFTRSLIHMRHDILYVECEGTCEVVNRGERV